MCNIMTYIIMKIWHMFYDEGWKNKDKDLELIEKKNEKKKNKEKNSPSY